jgi:hypothetical protein
MATTSIIADGTTEQASADFTLAAGESTTLSIRGTIVMSQTASVQSKQSDGTYTPFGEISSQEPVKVLAAAGTYRVVRRATASAFGVDRTT